MRDGIEFLRLGVVLDESLDLERLRVFAHLQIFQDVRLRLVIL